GAQRVVGGAFAAGRGARGEAWRFARLESALLVADAGGWLLRDRFVLRAPPAWDAAGLAEGARYFATIAAFGDGPWTSLPEDIEAVVAGRPGPRAAGGAPRRPGVPGGGRCDRAAT